MDIYSFLSDHQIPYERYDHQAVFTCEQAQELVPDIPAAETKNLFVKDKKSRRHFLVVTSYEKSVDLKVLSKLLGTSGLSLASSDRLQAFLGVEPGSVTLLALANDAQAAVEVILDEGVWQANALRCHPLVNTATLSITRGDLERFFQATGHNYRVMSVPSRD